LGLSKREIGFLSFLQPRWKKSALPNYESRPTAHRLSPGNINAKNLVEAPGTATLAENFCTGASEELAGHRL
jgi:hypothetical protein